MVHLPLEKFISPFSISTGHGSLPYSEPVHDRGTFLHYHLNIFQIEHPIKNFMTFSFVYYFLEHVVRGARSNTMRKEKINNSKNSSTVSCNFSFSGSNVNYSVSFIYPTDRNTNDRVSKILNY